MLGGGIWIRETTGNAAMVFDAYIAAEQGDPSGLLPLQLLYDFEAPITWVAWGDFYAKSGIDYDPSRDYTAAMNPPGSILGSPLSLLFWSGDLGWPMVPVPEEFSQIQASDVQREAVERLLTSFFDTGVADDSLYPYTPVNFEASPSTPALAKIALGSAVLVAALVVTATALVIRWMRRRKARGRV